MSTQTETAVVEKTIEQPVTESPVTTQPPQIKKRGKIKLLLLIFLLGCTFVLSYLLWQNFIQQLPQELDALNQQISQLKTDLHALQSKNNQAQLETLQTEIKALSKQQHNLDSHLTRLVYQIEQLPQYNDDDLKLSEIDYLLNIALYRLRLAHDPEGALMALKAADAGLQRLNQSIFFQVREQLLEDIRRLRELERPDIVGLATRLTQYAAQSDTLPLLQGYHQSDTPPVEETVPLKEQNWQTWLWETLKQLVVVRYNDEGYSHFLTPEQRSIVMQTLSLKIENARFFLLRHNTPHFAASIQTVRDWLKRYYDQNDNRVKRLQKDLTEMQTINLNPPLPDISTTLEQLQRLSIKSTRLQSETQRNLAQ